MLRSRTPSLQVALGLLSLAVGCASVLPPSSLPESEVSETEQVVGGPIAPGPPFEVDLTEGASWHAYFSTSADSYFQLVVEQRSLDVAVRVVDSEGNALAVADGSGGIGVDERLAARLPTGSYRLVLEPRSDGPASGRVRVQIEALRPFETEDHDRLRWTAMGQEATHLDGSSAEHDWRRSLRLSTLELEGWQTLGDTSGMIRALSRMTSLERELGPLDAAIDHGEEAVRLAVDSGSPAEEARSRYWLAQSLLRTGRSDDCREQLELGLVAAERAEDLALQGRIINFQGRLAGRADNLADERRLYTRALELRRLAQDTRGIRSLLNNLGIVAEATGDLTLALAYFRESIEEAERIGTPGAGLQARSNLSSLLASRGQWQEALDSLTTGLTVAREINDRPSESSLSLQLAHLLLSLGEPEPARELLLRALELNEARSHASYTVSVLIPLGQLELDRGNLEKAEKYFDRAFELSRSRQLLELTHWAVRNLAALRRAQGRPNEALDLLSSVAEVAQAAGRPISETKTHKSMAETYLALSRPEKAAQQLDLALTALGLLRVPELRFEIAFLRARVEHALGNSDEAVAEAEGALARLEQLRRSVKDPDLRATFLSRVKETFDFTVARLLELHRAHPEAGFDRRAFATLERGRARSLVEMLSRARAGAEDRLDPELLERERSARDGVTAANRRLDAALLAGRTDDAGQLREELALADRQLEVAEGDIRRAAPRYASLRFADQYAVEELQSVLSPGVSLIEYSLQPEQSVAFIVSAADFTVVELASEEEIVTAAERLRLALTSPNRRAYASLLHQARDVGDLVLAPLLSALPQSHHLILVPDGALAYIPFEALRLAGASEDEVFLIERWATSYAGSGGVLRTLLQETVEPRGGQEVVAFADPQPPRSVPAMMSGAGVEAEISWLRLPGARREVLAIADTLGTRNTTTFVDQAADERTLKSDPTVSRARWLHIAAHAQIDERTPANSAIVLAPAPGEDGYLTVQEVFGLELAAELVVLSGCETALGRQIRGEGLIGLTRAFLYAGAQGIQVSLWKVADDTTPLLMSDFYANLGRDLGPAEALRAAKLASLEDPRRSHPFYWAPFVFIGS